MNKEEIDGITECCIDGIVVTAELLSTYIRSWARQGVYFKTRYPVHPGRLSGDDVVAGIHIVHGHPDTAKCGKLNGGFLHPAGLHEVFRERTAADPLHTVVVLPVSHIYGTEGLAPPRFLDRLVPFLSALPTGQRYALGVRNSEYLLPAYFDSLHKHSVAHMFCTGGTMPGLLDQARLPYALTADVAVVLAEPSLDVEWQLGMMEIVRRCIDARKELYICLDSVTVCQTMLSLAVFMEMMSGDLAKLSPVRATKAA